jgi:hypothetical protein
MQGRRHRDVFDKATRLYLGQHRAAAPSLGLSLGLRIA